MRSRVPLNGLCLKPPRIGSAPAPRDFAGLIHQKTLGNNTAVRRSMDFSTGLRLRALGNTHGMRTRFFSDGACQKPLEKGSGSGRGTKSLPWIAAAYSDGETKRIDKRVSARSRNSSWEQSASSYFSRNGRKSVTDDDTESRAQPTEVVKDWRRRSSSEETARGEKKEEVEEMEEPVNDPRWNRIKSRFNGVINRESRFEKPQVARWNEQENWGRKTWKEATESSVPKMVGEGVYGVGPVLAALTIGRREFYALYVQEGLDLSGTNNRKKKKDKKGAEKVLRMAEKIGLAVKETSKHDLNMVVDNRPHQGLVLDASPLEMVSIRELEPVLVNKPPPLWVALDEVTDPQNLGAIVRSAYYFGVQGLVLCAKNSAPLSGVVSKASAGSLELIELRYCKNMMQFLTSSSENGWRVLGGSVSSRALPLSEVEAGAPTILVLGSEGSGLRPLVERSCSQLVRIPGNIDVYAGEGDEEGGEEMEKRNSSQEFKSFLAVESLNVSVAAGVLIYHLVGNNNNPVLVEKQTGE